MRVTMLGISGSGKTSYMSGLAQRMCNIGVGGFTIAPTGDDPASAAIERSKFARLMFSNNDFDFPPGTTNTTDWIFALSKDSGSKVFFEWIDFRGGFIDQLQTGISQDSQNDIKNFLTYTQASDAILVFVDSIRLYKYQGNRPALEQFTKLSALFQYILDFSEKNPQNTKKTLVIVNTKADSDLIPEEYQKNNFSRLNELAKLELNRYIDPLHKYGWHVGICSTGAVGIGRVNSNETPGKSFRKPSTIEAEIIDHPDPVNVEIPLLYCLLQEVRKISLMTANSLFQKEHVRNKIESESKFMDYVKTTLQKTESIKHRLITIDKAMREEQKLLQSFQPLIPDLENIVRNKILILSV